MVLFHPHANSRIHLSRLGLSRNGIMAVLTCGEGTTSANTVPIASTMANSTIRAP